MSLENGSPPRIGAWFWRRGDCQPTAEVALEKLCRNYWYPLYAFARRLGYAEEKAKDLTRGFLLVCARTDLRQAQRERASFEHSLLTAFKHFAADAWDRETALKRGGGREILVLR